MKNNKKFAIINLDSILNSENFANRENERQFFTNLFNSFEVSEGSKMVIMDVKDLGAFGELKSCKSTSTNATCVELYQNLDQDFINYIRTIYVDITCDYILVVKYNTCNNTDNCRDYYSWVSVL